MSKPNKFGGNKYKKKKRINYNKERILEIADTNQVYGKVTKKLGGNFIELLCSDGQIRKGQIRGKIRKREWLNENDVVLCTLHTFGTDMNNKDKCTVEIKYRSNEISDLKSKGLLTFEDNNSTKFDMFEEDSPTNTQQVVSFDDIVKPKNNNNDVNNEVNGDYDIDALLDML
jgi:translation initiation factor 1A